MDRIFLYEVYNAEKALEGHRQALHLKIRPETVKDWLGGEPQRHVCSTVIATEEPSKAVKP